MLSVLRTEDRRRRIRSPDRSPSLHVTIGVEDGDLTVPGGRKDILTDEIVTALAIKEQAEKHGLSLEIAATFNVQTAKDFLEAYRRHARLESWA